MTTTYVSNDFNDILDSLTLFMKNQDEFKDMNFDGSGIKQLLRVLAYNSQQQAYQNNFVFNELQLDSAQLRPNLTSIASRLGYMPASMKAAKINVDINVVPSDVGTAPVSLLLSRDTQFYATKDGQTFILSPDMEYTANISGGSYAFKGVTLLQGIWVINGYLVQSQYGNDSYVIPNNGVDTSTLEVSVRASETSSTPTIYNQFTTAYDLGAGANLYFLRENRDGLYEFKFGDNQFATKLDYGNVVTIRYLVTKGDIGNNLTDIKPASSIGGNYNITLTNNDNRTYGGADQEDIESIRTLAPLAFAASGNAVTSGDYVALTKQLFSEAYDVIAWGGEDNIPARYGYVFVSVIPKSSESLSVDQKNSLADILKQYNVGSVTPLIVDPVYTYVNLNTTVKYRPSSLIISTTALQNKVSDYCRLYSRDKMERFGGILEMSNLSEFINNIDASIKGNISLVSYEKRFSPNLNSYQSYDVYFNHKISPGTVNITGFKISDVDQSGWYYSIVDVDGNLVLKKTKNGIDKVMVPNIGTVNYDVGTISLVSFRPSELTDLYVTVQCSLNSLEDQSITSNRNSIIKFNNINVGLAAVNK